MNLTYDSKMFRETFESEFTWLNGFMRNVDAFRISLLQLILRAAEHGATKNLMPMQTDLQTL